MMRKDSVFLGRNGLAKPHGFTLLELALVLAIFGLIIAGAFMAASQAIKANKANHLQQQIISIVENIRSYSRRVDNSTINLAMTDVSNLGLLPKDIGNTGTPYVSIINGDSYPYYGAYGTGIDVCAAGGANNLANVCASGNYNNSNNTTGILIDTFVPRDICVQLISRFSAIYNDVGLAFASVNGNGTAPGWAQDLTTVAGVAYGCSRNIVDPQGNQEVRLWFNF